jgi:hypothetical protein
LALCRIPPVREYSYHCEIAEIGTIVASPSTPVAATPLASVPS